MKFALHHPDRGDRTEMCNLYLMYYTNWEKNDPVITCVSKKIKVPALPASSLVPKKFSPELETYALGKLGRLGYKLPVHELFHMYLNSQLMTDLLTPAIQVLERQDSFKEVADKSCHVRSEAHAGHQCSLLFDNQFIV